MTDFKQTPENLLAELTQMLYGEARTMNMLRPKQEADDPVTKLDYEMKNRMLLLAAYLLRDVLYYEGEHFHDLLEEAAAKGISLYHCEVHDNVDRIMPPP